MENPLEERLLGRTAEDLQILVHAYGPEGERVAPHGVPVHHEPAMLEDLQPEDGRDLVEVHEVDVAPEDLLQIRLGLEDVEGARALPEQSAQVHVRVLPRRASRLGAVEPESVEPKPGVQEVGGTAEIFVAKEHAGPYCTVIGRRKA
jgi:hypothetical protein